MQNPDDNQRTALLKAADIQPPNSLRDRATRAIARQRPLEVKPKTVYRTAGIAGRPVEPTFEQTEEGSGAFGRWTLDEQNLPAYDYDMNQRRDTRAYYLNSEGLDRRDHWHQIGNDRITGLASNDGVVQVYLADRGGVFLNYFEAFEDRPPRTLTGYIDAFLRFVTRVYGRLYGYWVRLRTRDQIQPRIVAGNPPTTPEKVKSRAVSLAYSGGFGYLNDGTETWATAFRYGPEGAETKRIFGMGYYRTEMTYREIKTTRSVYAPTGNDPILLVDVEIENRRTTAVELQHCEYWDVNVRQLQVQWLRAGLAVPGNNIRRALINDNFTPQLTFQTDPQTLRFHQEFRNGMLVEEIKRREVDSTPPDVFLANLNTEPAEYYTDKLAFFGSGSVRKPGAVEQKLAGDAELLQLDGSMPYCMALRHNLHLEPGAKIRLRYAYGAVTPGKPLDFVDKYRDGDYLGQTLQQWKDRVAHFSTGRDPILQREAAWHSYKMLSATLYSDYYQTHYTPQGSAYLYLHGADGVPRDQAIFTLPMVYIRPDLAREMLKLLMGLRDANTLALPYAFVGNGAHSNALGFHAHPSDLDLFFLMAILEYLAATGDNGFLTDRVPLYQPGVEVSQVRETSVLDHIRLAVKHLLDLRRSPHGLLSIGDGDWDDGIVISNLLDTKTLRLVDLRNTIQLGESVLNSQMALYVLPLTAAVLEKHDAALTAHLRTFTDQLKEAVKKQWDEGQGWFYRAYLRSPSNEERLIGDHHLSLQSQVWPLISGLAAEMGIEEKLIETIKTNLDDPSPTGAMLEQKGQVWPAISQLLTWGYQRSRPDLAWRSLNRHTFAAHATVFPNVWFNIWSGPDGTNSQQSPNPGGTWASPVTPMTDFPITNANQNAMALLALLRVCGIEPSMRGDGLDIRVKAPLDRFTLHTELLTLNAATNQISGEYHAAATGSCTLHIQLPAGAAEVVATLNGETVKGVGTGQTVDIPMMFSVGETLTFSVEWR